MKKIFIFLASAILCFGLLSCDLLTKDDDDLLWGGDGGGNSNPLIPPYEVKKDGTEIANLVFNGRILQDGEKSEAVMDNTLRWWKLTEPVRVETENKSTSNGSLAVVKDNQIRVTSYSLYPISNVEVYGNGTKLFTIRTLPALAEQVYELPNGEKNNKYTSYSVQSNDAHYKKITAVTMPMTLKFHKYTGNNLWGDLGPLEAREYIAYWTNMAYTFSSPEFDTLLNKYKTLTGEDFKDDHDSNGTLTNHNLETDTTTRNEIKTRISREKDLGIGLLTSDPSNNTNPKGGQATPSMLAITPVNLPAAYFIGLGVGIHEFGHTIAYDHSSSFSSDLQNYAGGLSATLIRLKKAPYCDVDFVGYHQQGKPRKFSNPDQAMLTKYYNESKIKREYTHWHQATARDPITNVLGYQMTPGKNPKEGGSSIIPPAEKTNESDQFVNAFEKAVYKNPNIYPDLNTALKSYFDTAKAAGIDLTK